MAKSQATVEAQGCVFTPCSAMRKIAADISPKRCLRPINSLEKSPRNRVEIRSFSNAYPAVFHPISKPNSCRGRKPVALGPSYIKSWDAQLPAAFGNDGVIPANAQSDGLVGVSSQEFVFFARPSSLFRIGQRNAQAMTLVQDGWNRVPCTSRDFLIAQFPQQGHLRRFPSARRCVFPAQMTAAAPRGIYRASEL